MSLQHLLAQLCSDNQFLLFLKKKHKLLSISNMEKKIEVMITVRRTSWSYMCKNVIKHMMPLNTQCNLCHTHTHTNCLTVSPSLRSLPNSMRDVHCFPSSKEHNFHNEPSVTNGKVCEVTQLEPASEMMPKIIAKPSRRGKIHLQRV